MNTRERARLMDDATRIKQITKTGKQSRRTVIQFSEALMRRAEKRRLESIEKLLKHAEQLGEWADLDDDDE